MRRYESPYFQPQSQYAPDYFLTGDEPLANGDKDVVLLGYFDKRRPANDNRSVVRFIPDDNDYCSTRQRYVAVRLPRVSMVDGKYRRAREADNNNRRAA